MEKQPHKLSFTERIGKSSLLLIGGILMIHGISEIEKMGTQKIYSLDLAIERTVETFAGITSYAIGFKALFKEP